MLPVDDNDKPQVVYRFSPNVMASIGITVQLDTVVLGAIGFMRIRNKSGGTLVNPDFHSPNTWS